MCALGMLKPGQGINGIKKFVNMKRGIDGRLRYTLEKRVKIYSVFREWLDGDIPVSLCKETKICWSQVKGKFNLRCNCVE